MRAEDRQFLHRTGREQALAQEVELRLAAAVDAARGKLVEHRHGPADLDVDIADSPAGSDRDLGLAVLLQPRGKPEHRPRGDQNAQHSREQPIVFEAPHLSLAGSEAAQAA